MTRVDDYVGSDIDARLRPWSKRRLLLRVCSTQSTLQGDKVHDDVLDAVQTTPKSGLVWKLQSERRLLPWPLWPFTCLPAEKPRLKLALMCSILWTPKLRLAGTRAGTNCVALARCAKPKSPRHLLDAAVLPARLTFTAVHAGRGHGCRRVDARGAGAAGSDHGTTRKAGGRSPQAQGRGQQPVRCAEKAGHRAQVNHQQHAGELPDTAKQQVRSCKPDDAHKGAANYQSIAPRRLPFLHKSPSSTVSE